MARKDRTILLDNNKFYSLYEDTFYLVDGLEVFFEVRYRPYNFICPCILVDLRIYGM